jgi:hypothetical protein
MIMMLKAEELELRWQDLGGKSSLLNGWSG